MMRYELRKNTIEIRWKNRDKIMAGCTLEKDDSNPEIIEIFEDKEMDLQELKKYKSEVVELSGGAGIYYSVTEYYIEENEYDEDGEWVSGGDIWDFSEMDFKIA